MRTVVLVTLSTLSFLVGCQTTTLSNAPSAGLWRRCCLLTPESFTLGPHKRYSECTEYYFSKGNTFTVVRKVSSGADTALSKEDGTYFVDGDEVVYFFDEPPIADIGTPSKRLFMEHLLTCGAFYDYFRYKNDSLKDERGYGYFEHVSGGIPANEYQTSSELIGTNWRLPQSYTLSNDEVLLTLRFRSQNSLEVVAKIKNRERRLHGMYWTRRNTTFCIFSSHDDRSGNLIFENKWDQMVADALLKSSNKFVYRLVRTSGKLTIDGIEITKT